MNKSSAERKRQERKRKRDAGLVPVELWILPEYKAEVREKEKEWQK